MKSNTLVKKFAQLLLPILLFSASPTASAFQFVIQADLKAGGDTLESYTNFSGEQGDVVAGKGLTLSGGINLELTPELKLRSLIGTKATNGYSLQSLFSSTKSELVWSHTPLEFIVYAETTRLAYGGGLAIHLNPQLKGTGGFATLSKKYDTAIGLIGQVDYRMSKRFYMGLNYTLINYKGDDGTSVSGSGLGLDIGYSFGGN